MIAVSMRPVQRDWSTISFASTLFLRPILDLLLAKIPGEWQADLRLGLQEALVNAAKHGNQLDPGKTVVVRFSIEKGQYSWVISDQGTGFTPPACECHAEISADIPPEDSERGRGLCLLHQIFDRVDWNPEGTELRLSKQTKNRFLRQPIFR